MSKFWERLITSTVLILVGFALGAPFGAACALDGQQPAGSAVIRIPARQFVEAIVVVNGQRYKAVSRIAVNDDFYFSGRAEPLLDLYLVPTEEQLKPKEKEAGNTATILEDGDVIGIVTLP